MFVATREIKYAIQEELEENRKSSTSSIEEMARLSLQLDITSTVEKIKVYYEGYYVPDSSALIDLTQPRDIHFSNMKKLFFCDTVKTPIKKRHIFIL